MEIKLNERVKNLLKEQMWYLAAFDREPNAVPVAFKDITENGRLVVGDVFLETTLRSIQKNGRIAVSAGSGRTLEGYPIKGSAECVTEGPWWSASNGRWRPCSRARPPPRAPCSSHRSGSLSPPPAWTTRKSSDPTCRCCNQKRNMLP